MFVGGFKAHAIPSSVTIARSRADRCRPASGAGGRCRGEGCRHGRRLPAQAGQQKRGIAGSRRGGLPDHRGEAMHGRRETTRTRRARSNAWIASGWLDKIINNSYKTMMNALEPDQQAKLREMQRSSIHTRDLTCAFLVRLFPGHDGQSDNHILQQPRDRPARDLPADFCRGYRGPKIACSIETAEHGVDWRSLLGHVLSGFGLFSDLAPRLCHARSSATASACPFRGASGLLHRSKLANLFDNLIGLREERRRQREAEYLCVFKLMITSNVVGCSMGNSEGLAPLRIRSTKKAARRDKSATRAAYMIKPPTSTFSRKANIVGSRCVIALSAISVRRATTVPRRRRPEPVRRRQPQRRLRLRRLRDRSPRWRARPQANVHLSRPRVPTASRARRCHFRRRATVQLSRGSVPPA